MLRIALALSLLIAQPVTGQTFTGPVRVIDGDTIDVGVDHTIRLHGIDAPERTQTCAAIPCGDIARSWLSDQLRHKAVTCQQVDWDARYGRSVAKCYADGRDIGRMMVAAGYARAYLKYSSDYALEEKAASLNSLGFWRHGFGRPEDHRVAQLRKTEQQTGCVVKGNISPNTGERIYHVAGQRHYAQVSIDTRRGELCFANETEAQAAGWRKARR